MTELIKRHSKNIDKVNNLSRNVSDYKEVLNSQIMHNFVILLLLQTKEIKNCQLKVFSTYSKETENFVHLFDKCEITNNMNFN